jgi:Domain of unknown function (DUF222)/HNH endonuclease
MDSNTHSTQGPTGSADELADLSALLDRLDTRDLDRLSETARAERVMLLRPMVERLEGQWLKELAGVDARGAAGAEAGVQFGSTASWLRARLLMTAGAAASAVRTARALFRGPLPESGKALCAGEISAAHAKVLASGTKHLPDHVVADAEATLLDAARPLDPHWLRQTAAHLEYTFDPDRADRAAQRRYERRGLWFTTTMDRMLAVHGQLPPEAGQVVLTVLDSLSRPADHHDTRSGGQRTADALEELARQRLESGRLPITGGVRPQLSVIVDLQSLTGDPGGPGRPGRLGGEMGWAGPLEPEACRRLACDATVTRVVVSRQPLEACDRRPDRDPQDPTAREGWLEAVLARLPQVLGGAPTMPLNLGRSTRVVSAAQRSALAVRDGGCVFPGCSRPLAWCEAHHVWHWLDGGPTDLDNLALVCRAHHRAIHEGGWRLIRGPDGQFSATPPPRRHRTVA